MDSVYVGQSTVEYAKIHGCNGGHAEGVTEEDTSDKEN